MRACLLIKQLTIIINSIWLREQRSCPTTDLLLDLLEWKVRCNAPRAEKNKKKTLLASPPNANATIGQLAWFAHRIVSAHGSERPAAARVGRSGPQW